MQTRCVLRLFGVSALSIQQAAAGFPSKWEVRAQCRSRSSETLVALYAHTGDGLKKARQSLQACFSSALYGEGSSSLAEAAVQALETHHKLLVCSNAAAGALLESRLESVSGAEKVFDFGTMSYADAAVRAQIDRQIQRKAPANDAPAQTLVGVQTAQHLVGTELSAGCLEQDDARFLLVLGTKKGCWVRTVYETDGPGLWLLDMIRRAACGLPQADGTLWQRYRDPVPVQPALAGEEPVSPAVQPRKRHRLGRVVLVLFLLAALAAAACWWYTGGDFTALPQLLRTDTLPHAGAELL